MVWFLYSAFKVPVHSHKLTHLGVRDVPRIKPLTRRFVYDPLYLLSPRHVQNHDLHTLTPLCRLVILSNLQIVLHILHV